MKTLTEIFTPEELESMTRPLGAATAPPATYYTSPELYELEREHIFRKEWLWVGHAQDVREPGSYFTFEYAGEPILVTRDKTGQLNAFSNVCRHRGAIVAEGAGTCKSFSCPYHTWTYGHDGKLLGAPAMDGVENFAPGSRPMSPARWDSRRSRSRPRSSLGTGTPSISPY